MIGNRKRACLVGDDRRLIERNAKKMDVIAAYCAENRTELAALKEKLKYLIPSETGEVLEWDNKISAMLDDFKLEVSSKHMRVGKTITDFIVEIEAAIAERNARV